MTPKQWKDAMGLVRFLYTLPKKNWDMSHFSPHSFEDDIDGSLPASLKEIKRCGTACCVAGWAAARHQKVWPKYKPDSIILDVSEGTFSKFYGFSRYESKQICLRGMEMSPKEKADEVLEILNKPKYDSARLG